MYARRGDLRRYFRRRGQRRVEETSVQNRLLKPKLNAAPLQQMRERESRRNWAARKFRGQPHTAGTVAVLTGHSQRDMWT